MFKRILVAMDNSEMGKQVFAEALDLARGTDACLMLLHVLSPDEAGYPALPSFSYYYWSDAQEDLIEKYFQELEVFEAASLEMLRKRAQEADAVGIRAEFSQNQGNPGRQICALARNWGADLIAMGRRGRSGLNELFLGSVSTYVNHHAPCCVLTVQGKTVAPTQVTDQAAAVSA